MFLVLNSVPHLMVFFVFQQNYPSSDPHERTSLLHGELVEDDIKPPPYFSGKEPYLYV